MRRAAALLVLASLAVACGHPKPVPSALERFDRLGPKLRRMTGLSAAVATDTRALGKSVQADRAPQSRKGAARLHRDSTALHHMGQSLRRQVLTLISRASGIRVREYFRLTGETLAYQTAEGTALAEFAAEIDRDPLMEADNDAARFTSTLSRARQSAEKAARLAASAAVFRRRYSSSFRYIPVEPLPSVQPSRRSGKKT